MTLILANAAIAPKSCEPIIGGDRMPAEPGLDRSGRSDAVPMRQGLAPACAHLPGDALTLAEVDGRRAALDGVMGPLDLSGLARVDMAGRSSRPRSRGPIRRDA
jgi:hypothetical protein